MFLKILGITFLIILVLIIGTILYLRLRLGRDAMKLLFIDEEFAPLSLTLIEEISSDWKNTPEISQLAQALQTLGFEQNKAYRINEMKDSHVLHLSSEYAYANIHQYILIGTFVEFYAKDASGIEYVVLNSKQGNEMPPPPHVERYVYSDYDVKELYSAFQSLVSDKKLVALTHELFSELNENRYKTEIAYHNRCGGMSYESFEALAAQFPNILPLKKKPELLEKVFLRYKIKEFNSWIIPAINEYYHLAGVEPRAEDDFIIVPKDAYLPAFLNYLADENIILPDLDIYIEKYANEADNYAVFERINNLFSPNSRYKHIATQQYPLPLKIYSRK